MSGLQKVCEELDQVAMLGVEPGNVHTALLAPLEWPHRHNLPLCINRLRRSIALDVEWPFMPPSGGTLILLTAASIVFLLFLILVLKLHAFVGLMITAMCLGLAAGMPPEKVLQSVQKGF